MNRYSVYKDGSTIKLVESKDDGKTWVPYHLNAETAYPIADALNAWHSEDTGCAVAVGGLGGAGVTPNGDYVRRIPMQAQRQDSLVAQLETVHEAATRLGCYDAADWIWLQLGRDGSVAYGEPSPTHNGSSGAQ